MRSQMLARETKYYLTYVLKMCDICYSSNYVQVDLFNKSQITLDDQYKNTLEECAQFIEKVNMDDKKLYIDHYKDKFLENMD